MNLKQLPYFVAIAETGNLSAAARKAGVSQPAVSGYLQELERELGTPLFERRYRHMILTEAGKIYLDMARQILDMQAYAFSLIQTRHHPKKQVVRIGVTPYRGVPALAVIYQPFIKKFPLWDLQPYEHYIKDTFQMLRSGTLDLAFATAAEPFTDPSLHILPMQKEEIVLAIPAFHQLALYASRDITNAPQINLQSFQDTPFILMDTDSTVGQISQQFFAKSGFDPVVVFRSNSVLMVNEMIRSGAGVGFIPANYAKPHDAVVYFRLKPARYIICCVVWNNNHQLTEAERYLIYLRSILWDRQNMTLLTDFLWPDELIQLLKEFDPDYLIPKS